MEECHQIKAFLNNSDEELAKLATDNQDAFFCIMKRYEGKLMSYIMRISGFSKEDAEDVLQEVFIKTYVNLNSFDDGLKFSSWIYRIAHNETINTYRKKKVRPQAAMGLDNDFLSNLASDFKMDDKTDIEFLKTHTKEALERLDVKYREILILRFWEDRDYKEISDILKKPMGTVATLISRAKKALEDELTKEKDKFI